MKRQWRVALYALLAVGLLALFYPDSPARSQLAESDDGDALFALAWLEGVIAALVIVCLVVVVVEGILWRRRVRAAKRARATPPVSTGTA